ncbi:unnamed protein product [Periconia digitata]|uniref:Apple domain-containing protein n=1 Tax=Periconia digitata TaxID=1303443 RepID=A0A9W4UGL9_9PLEO|nr:unnamed protein product [Periconia digitata]
MKSQLLLTVALAASASARVIEGRQAKPPPAPAATGDLGKCGLDSFDGHPNEANRFCSSILVSGTLTVTTTISKGSTSTVSTTVFTTITRTSTPKPPITTPTSTPKPPITTPTPTPTPTKPTSSPSPTPTAGCGIVGYTKDTAAYYFDSSGTQNTFALCSAACKADAKCKSFGYGEANCMLFDVDATSNTNYNPQSPYTFYDAACPVELPVRKKAAEKRQISISLGISDPAKISSACFCYLGTVPAGTTKTASVTTTGVVKVTSTVTRTLSLVDGRRVG